MDSPPISFEKTNLKIAKLLGGSPISIAIRIQGMYSILDNLHDHLQRANIRRSMGLVRRISHSNSSSEKLNYRWHAIKKATDRLDNPAARGFCENLVGLALEEIFQ